MATIISTKTSGVGGLEVTGDATGILQLASNNGTTAVTVNASQNVGIGTASPSARLHVSGISSGNSNIRLTNTFTGGRSWELNPYASGVSDIPFTIRDVTAGADRLTIDSSGNVGIGTSSNASSSKLDARGRIRCGSGTTNGDAELVWSNDSSVTNAWNMSVRTDVGGSNNDLKLLRYNSSGSYQGIAMQITQASGAVYFGGSSASDGIALIQKGGAGGGCIQQFFKPNSGATNVILNYYGTSTYVGGMNMDNTSTSFITSSDARLKKDIVESELASEKIDNIRVVSHGWKHDDSVVDYGLIAQELYEIMPRAVTKGDDNEEVETVWSVDYSKLVPMLIKAHQEQQAIINDLKARIETLEGASA